MNTCFSSLRYVFVRFNLFVCLSCNVVYLQYRLFFYKYSVLKRFFVSVCLQYSKRAGAIDNLTIHSLLFYSLCHLLMCSPFISFILLTFTLSFWHSSFTFKLYLSICTVFLCSGCRTVPESLYLLNPLLLPQRKRVRIAFVVLPSVNTIYSLLIFPAHWQARWHIFL